MNISEQLVDLLVQAGVKRLYAVAGDSLNYVNSAIHKSNKISWVHVRHEECGAFAAEAEAYLNGIGCCAGSSGPGHVHLINGLYDAHRAHLPVVAIASTCPSGEMGTGFFQETNPIKLFADCSLYNELAVTPQQFSRMMPCAIRAALSEGGVAVVGLPGDLASQEAVHASLAKSQSKQNGLEPSMEEVKALADMINASEKVTLFCGYGAAAAHDSIVALADKIKSPVVYTYRGKMKMEYDNPYAVGMTGLLGIPSGYMALEECDLLIMLGTDFPFTHFIPKDCRIVQVDIRAEHIGRRADVELAVHADVGKTIAMLMDCVEVKSDNAFCNTYVKLYGKVKQDLKDLSQNKGEADLIAPEYLASLIDTLASDTAFFSADTGMCCTWSARFLNASKGRDLLASFNHGTMCNALPMAIGAVMARPDREVVAMCGDGGLSMLLGELATVAQYKLPIKIVVFNNRSLGMVKLEMEADGLIDTETDMYNPDFASVAAAVGIASYKVTDPEALEGVMKEVFAHQGPVLVDVHTNPNALSMPPKISLSQMKGFSMSMGRMLLAGDREEMKNILKAMVKLL